MEVERWKSKRGDCKAQAFMIRDDVWRALKKHQIDENIRMQDFYEDIVLKELLRKRIIG